MLEEMLRTFEEEPPYILILFFYLFHFFEEMIFNEDFSNIIFIINDLGLCGGLSYIIAKFFSFL
jgi:hypothetical protein